MKRLRSVSLVSGLARLGAVGVRQCMFCSTTPPSGGSLPALNHASWLTCDIVPILNPYTCPKGCCAPHKRRSAINDLNRRPPGCSSRPLRWSVYNPNPLMPLVQHERLQGFDERRMASQRKRRREGVVERGFQGHKSSGERAFPSP